MDQRTSSHQGEVFSVGTLGPNRDNYWKSSSPNPGRLRSIDECEREYGHLSLLYQTRLDMGSNRQVLEPRWQKARNSSNLVHPVRIPQDQGVSQKVPC